MTKLEKLRDEVDKATRRYQEAEQRLEESKKMLKQAENEAILNSVAKYNMTPEELAAYLEKMRKGEASNTTVADKTAETAETTEVIEAEVVDAAYTEDKEDFEYEEC